MDLSSHTTILATTSRTILTQEYFNSTDTNLNEVQYTFPLYDGVSVVGFKCTVASRTIVGVVREKQQARAEYKAAVERGEAAGLLEQLPEASDVFTTRIGNVPATEAITVEIVYLGELKHDAETDGVRFTIPTAIAPRYGSSGHDSTSLSAISTPANDKKRIRIIVDVVVDQGSVVRGLQSPTHPIAVSIGRTSSTQEGSDTFDNHLASATLTLGSTVLEKDFIIVVLAKDQGTPRAMLEQHPSIQGQRALMATLVPKFNLPPIHPEIVFVVDRSGSMESKIDTLVAALEVFLKSLPVGVKFNICSFGSHHTFLWPRSKTYDQSSLQTALDHLRTFAADYGGTEMLRPVEDTVKNRYKDMPLEVMLLTDGGIWNQQGMFDFVNKTTGKGDARFFSLGIGAGASSSLVEGIARAGNGFAQFVGEDEKMDKRLVRMLKGALTPHIRNYTLEVKYDKEDDDFEMVESVTYCLGDLATSSPDSKASTLTKKAISLFDQSATKEVDMPPAGKYDHLPILAVPKLVQAPHKIPSLYPFNRTTVYLLMSAETCQRVPRIVVLRATCEHGPLELEIPIQDVGVGETIHQLAAKKAIHELEEGRGWITEAKDDGKLIKDQYEGRWDEIVEREAVRLGVQFHVGGKWCSFVAVEGNSQTGESTESTMEQRSKSGATQFGTLRQKSRKSFGGPSLGSNFCAVSPTSSFAFAQNRQESPSKPAASGGLFGGNNSNVSGGLFGNPSGGSASTKLFGNASASGRLSAQRSPSPNAPGNDPVVSPFGSSTDPVGTRGQTHANDVCSTAVSSNNSGGLFSFGGSPRSILKSYIDPDPGQCRESLTNTQTSASFASSQPFGALAPRQPGAQESRQSGTQASLLAVDGTIGFSNLDSEHGAAKRTTKSQTMEDRMRALIALQEFDGAWLWVTELFAAMGMDETNLKAICASAGLADGSQVQATIVAIAFLQTKVKDHEEVWEMVVEKAMEWLNGKVDEGQLSMVKEAMAQE